jgi:hypothetical protein
VQDLDRQVFALLTKELLRLLGQDDSCTVVWIDDVVADFEIALESLDFEVGVRRRVGFS